MPMTLRERLLTTLRGGTPDRIPWNIYKWLLPATVAGSRLHEKGLGLMGSARIFRPVYTADITIREERTMVANRPLTRVWIETPVGTLTEEYTLDPSYSSPWRQKYFISGPEDYAPAEYFFQHTRFEPDFEPWRAEDAATGKGGIVVGEIMPIPILYLMVSWMGAEGLAEGFYVYPERFDALIEALDRHYDRQIDLATDSPAEVIWFPDNVTGTIISPRLFARYCAPTYDRAMPIMRAADKIPIAHYDGSNRPLKEALANTDLPVIEAFTPPPMGDLSVAEAKAAWPDKVVWVNFPGNYFLEPAEAIQAYALDLLREGAPGGRFVLGCTEDFPLDQFDKTFSALGRALAAYEGHPW